MNHLDKNAESAMLELKVISTIPKVATLLEQNNFEETHAIILDIIAVLDIVRDAKAEKRNHLFGTNLEYTAENERREKDIALLEDALTLLKGKAHLPQSYTQTDLSIVENLVKKVLA